MFTYTVRPVLPAPLAFLSELAYNLWWSFSFDAIDLFRALDAELWDALGQNPVRLLGQVGQGRLAQLASDAEFLAQLARVEAQFRSYLQQPGWLQHNYPDAIGTVAYFSMEYGLARCLPVYSGGLGVLSGDHLKTASDMGVPLVGIGLAYGEGYFRQYLNADGWQQERYEENDFYNMPIAPVLGADGQRLLIEVPYAGAGGNGRSVAACLWRVNVGRVPLYLLSSNVEENALEDLNLTAQLYGGDRETRIRQEIVLGIGGLAALSELGYEPSVCHMNEGHSAFLALERARLLMQRHGLSFAEAYELVFTSNIFTTHTPVPAGNDVFDEELLQRYLGPLASGLELSWEQFMDFGRSGANLQVRQQQGTPADGGPGGPPHFSMPVLALQTSAFSNGVSQLHASVSRAMWEPVWPRLPVDEVPISAVTNGVHLNSWTAREVSALFDRYLGAEWRDDPTRAEAWQRLSEVPDEELWQVRNLRRKRLVDIARSRLSGAPLQPNALTIGFARRFASYKRATLLLRDLSRLARLLGDPERPVQFIFAGKAHPRDDDGKNLIRQIVHATREPELAGRFVFIEDYDLQVARYLVQGCDVWLNNPRRPLEASGTSGMKAVLNGGLHLSTLDGWWAQAYSPEVGWAIGDGEEYNDEAYGDEVEGNALFDLLEHEVIPLFWDRNGADLQVGTGGPGGPPHSETTALPSKWIAKMKASMVELIPRFCAHRMLRNYIEEAYLPAARRFAALSADNCAGARTLAAWRSRVLAAWDGVRIVRMEVRPGGLASGGEAAVGQPVEVRATLELAGLLREDVQVEAYSGPVDNEGHFHGASGVPLAFESSSDEGPRFAGGLASAGSGHFGLTVRVFPKNDALPSKYALFRVTWNE